MKFCQKLTALVFSVVLIMSMFACGDGDSLPAISHTQEANDSFKKADAGMSIKLPTPTNDEEAKIAIEALRTTYEKAGYSLDKSIIKFSEDYAKQPDGLFLYYDTQYMVPLVKLIRWDKNMPLEKHFAQDTYAALQKLKKHLHGL